ncbi:MAG TPA: endolytic transglycosylase MltG [Ktedonobacteraceae bacterium]|nr:endolytic transglycosylase MltG [Ktedonobacteraceae bacterium]
MKRRGARASIFAVLLLGLLIFGGVYFAWTTVSDVFQPANANASNKIAFVIQSGETGTQIADQLQAKGLIRNALAFRVWVKIKGVDTTQFKAGAYNLSPNMTIDQIISQLLLGQPDEVPVVILEGWRLEQTANQFAHNNPVYQPLVKFRIADFLNIVRNPAKFQDRAKYPFLQSIPAGNSMEGFLFPDTYLIPVDATANDVVDILLNNFASKVQQDHLDTLAKQNKLTLYQMVTLASIVQREALFDADRPLVASVYWNRIYRPNAETVSELDADPTVQYARDSQPGTTKYWTPLNDSGRNILPTNPYNTYTHQGFPPSPICSPGLASLLAAANPAKSDYYFFLSKSNGQNVYAKTAAEFQADEQKYLGIS